VGLFLCNLCKEIVCPSFQLAGVEMLLRIGTFIKMHLKELLFSQERDRQPTIKFYRQRDTAHIYQLIPRNKYFHVVCIRERKKKALKKHLIGVVSKVVVYPSKPCVLGIS
jgi:hypothetical protein